MSFLKGRTLFRLWYAKVLQTGQLMQIDGGRNSSAAARVPSDKPSNIDYIPLHGSL